MTSIERDVLTGLRDSIVTPAATGQVSLFGLSDDPDADVQSALSFTRGPTDPLGRWGQGVLTLLTRADRGKPLLVHDYATPVVAALLSVAGVTYGATTVNWVDHRGSSAGMDSSKRWVRADTFFLDLDYQA